MSLADMFDRAAAYLDGAKKQKTDYTAQEVYEELLRRGFSVSRTSIYRQFKALNVTRNNRGYYDPCEIAVVLGWYQSNGEYPSYARYLEVAGQAIYDSYTVQATAQEA